MWIGFSLVGVIWSQSRSLSSGNQRANERTKTWTSVAAVSLGEQSRMGKMQNIYQTQAWMDWRIRHQNSMVQRCVVYINVPWPLFFHRCRRRRHFFRCLCTAEAMPENKACFNAIKWAATFYDIVFPPHLHMHARMLACTIQITPFILANAKYCEHKHMLPLLTWIEHIK